MKNCTFILIISCLILAKPIFPDVIEVPDEQPTIQEGIDAAAEGDTVLVSAGHYEEIISFKGKNILVTSGFLFEEDPSLIDSTIIDGSFLKDDDTTSVVRFVSGEGTGAMLAGFTITGGQGTVGIHGSRKKGGGIFVADASPTIKFNIIKENQAFEGGGIYLFFSDSEVERNIIARNSATLGGGIMTRRSTGMIVNNTIDGNTAHRSGGGIAVVGGPLGKEAPILRNNIISNNMNAGIWEGDIDSLFVDYNNTFNNTGGATRGSVYEGFGQIHCDPKFVDGEAGDYRLRTLSPCIDAGSEEFTEIPPLGGDRIDIGAWEYLYEFSCQFFKFFKTPTEAFPCDTVSWDVQLTNKTDSVQVYDVWVDVSGPKCNLWDYIPDLAFPPRTTYRLTVELGVPCCARPGQYIAKGKIGVFDEYILTAEVFQGEVLEDDRPDTEKKIAFDDDWWLSIEVSDKMFTMD